MNQLIHQLPSAFFSFSSALSIELTLNYNISIIDLVQRFGTWRHRRCHFRHFNCSDFSHFWKRNFVEDVLNYSFHSKNLNFSFNWGHFRPFSWVLWSEAVVQISWFFEDLQKIQILKKELCWRCANLFISFKQIWNLASIEDVLFIFVNFMVGNGRWNMQILKFCNKLEFL